jgi:hypothetical protein
VRCPDQNCLGSLPPPPPTPQDRNYWLEVGGRGGRGGLTFSVRSEADREEICTGEGGERDRRMVGRRKKEEKTRTVDMFEWEHRRKPRGNIVDINYTKKENIL